MGEGKIIEMKPVSLYEVKDTLKERKSEKELTYEQDVTLKFVEKFAKTTEKQTTDLLKGLDEIEFLKEDADLKYQIAAALPTKLEQVRLFVPKDVEATDEDLTKILELTKTLGEKL
jgi:DNA-directed RNA polymerase subunit F